MPTWLKELMHNSDLLYFLAGLCSSFVTYLLRSRGYTGKSFAYRISNGFTCVMLSCGTIMAFELSFHSSWAWSVPIGIAIGALGADLILSIIVRLVEFRLGIGKGKEDNDNNLGI